MEGGISRAGDRSSVFMLTDETFELRDKDEEQTEKRNDRESISSSC